MLLGAPWAGGGCWRHHLSDKGDPELWDPGSVTSFGGSSSSPELQTQPRLQVPLLQLPDSTSSLK